MAFSNSTLLSSLVLVLILILVLANKVVSQGDTTTFTYDTFSSNPETLTYQGDAFVPTSLSFLRLTKVDDDSGEPKMFSTGRVVHSSAVMFWDEGVQASFETTIKFIISPSKNYPNRVGDGLAFFIVPFNSPIPPGSVSGNLGLFDPATGLAPSVFAVEFHTAPNGLDPRSQHIGIDINSRVSKNVTIFSGVGQEVTARINYVSSTRTITVVATYGSEMSTLSYVFDLKTILPKEVHVGITATTGAYVAFHDINAWYFSSTLVDDALDENYIRQYV